MNGILKWSALDPGLLILPLLAGVFILATHVPLGRRVLSRGIIFLDLAVAQLAVLGVIIAYTLGWETRLANPIGRQQRRFSGRGLIGRV